MLLIFVFIASVGTAVAEDVSDDSNELKIDNVDEVVSVDEESDILDEETEEDEDIAAVDDEEEEETEYTTLSIKVDVLDKPVAGETFRLKVTVTNTGDADAENVRAGVSFADLKGAIDKSFILVDDEDIGVTEKEGIYIIDFDYIGAGESDEVTLTFLATQGGLKMVGAVVKADNSIPTEESEYYTFIDVAENSNDEIKANAATQTLPATGNPLVLLALALFAIVPCYRRR